MAFVSTLRLLVSFSLPLANECLLYICACLDAGSLGFVVSRAEFLKNNREFEMADVVVFGVCGEVGRAVAKHLGKVFRVQGVAYDDNDQCKADLMSAGVNVTSFDRKALCDVTRGVKFCFVNTRSSFADASSHAKEVEQGVAIADACKQSDVTHVVYMTQHHVANAIGLSARQADAKVHVVHTCLSYQSFVCLYMTFAYFQAEVYDYMLHVGLSVTGIVVTCFYEDLLKPPLAPVPCQDDIYGIGDPDNFSTIL